MLTPREQSPLPEKNLLRGGSNPRRCITQDSELNTLPTSCSGPCATRLTGQPLQYRLNCFVNTFLAKSIPLSCLPCSRYFGLPVSVYRYVNDEECLPLVSVSKGCRPPRWPSGKASASRPEGPGFESRLRRDFFGVGSYQ